MKSGENPYLSRSAGVFNLHTANIARKRCQATKPSTKTQPAVGLCPSSTIPGPDSPKLAFPAKKKNTNTNFANCGHVDAQIYPDDWNYSWVVLSTRHEMATGRNATSVLLKVDAVASCVQHQGACWNVSLMPLTCVHGHMRQLNSSCFCVQYVHIVHCSIRLHHPPHFIFV